MKSEVNKLRADVEWLAGVSPAAMKPPSDVPAETWCRMLEILETLPPEAFHPWESLEHVAAWVEEQNPDVLNEYPDPVMAAYFQARAEQAGEPVPPAANLTDEMLLAMIGNGGRLPADFDGKPGDGPQAAGGNNPPERRG